MELEEFLKKRNLEHLIGKFKEEKIDIQVLKVMSDEELRKAGVSSFGDMIALKAFCRSSIEPEEQSSTDILARIRGKLESKLKNNAYRKGNKNAVKVERRIELGWLLKDGDDVRQVRAKSGGGTRKLSVDLDVTVSEVKDLAVALFFPDGKCKFGMLESFSLSMTRFDEEKITNETKTVRELYEETKVKMVRMYLCAELIDKAQKVDPNAKRLRPSKNTTYKHDSDTEELPELPPTRRTRRTESQMLEKKVTEEAASMMTPEVTSTPIHEVHFAESPEESSTQQKDADATEDIMVDYALNQSSLGSDDSGIVQFMTGTNIPVLPDLNDLDDTVPMDPTTYQQLDIPKITVHRGHVFADMNNMIDRLDFMTTTLEVDMILPNGTKEMAADSGGVLRDCLSEYWQTFYTKCTSGNALKVPTIRHDMIETWPQVAKVLVLGHKLTGYFPVALAQPFVVSCFGQRLGKKELVDAFKKFIPVQEEQLIVQPIDNVDLSSDEFLDFLEAHDVKVCVTKENWPDTLYQIAHKELVQEPAYIADCWGEILKTYLHLPHGGIDEIYSKLAPSPRKIINMLDHRDELNQKERNVFDYLKKFIRQGGWRMERFLRYCTGADILVCPKISVRFVEAVSVFSRRPVAHTCGCILELPVCYNSAMEFAEEFDQILESNVWVMDIV